MMWNRIAILILLSPNVLLAAYKAPKPGTYYTLDQIGIKKQELKRTQLHLTFKPKDEQFFWCPGVKIQVTKQATIVTFVRCATSKNCSIDKKATIGKRLIRKVTIDTKGKDIYVLNGPKKFKRIYQAPRKTKAAGELKSKNKAQKSSAKQVDRVSITNSFLQQ